MEHRARLAAKVFICLDAKVLVVKVLHVKVSMVKALVVKVLDVKVSMVKALVVKVFVVKVLMVKVLVAKVLVVKVLTVLVVTVTAGRGGSPSSCPPLPAAGGPRRAVGREDARSPAETRSIEPVARRWPRRGGQGGRLAGACRWLRDTRGAARALTQPRTCRPRGQPTRPLLSRQAALYLAAFWLSKVDDCNKSVPQAKTRRFWRGCGDEGGDEDGDEGGGEDGAGGRAAGGRAAGGRAAGGGGTWRGFVLIPTFYIF